jgi:hypothetical protein
MPFPDMDVSVTMTGEEWTALLGRLISRELSKKGERVYLSATTKLKNQLLAASDANPSLDSDNKENK